MALERRVRWTDWQGNGLEHLSVAESDDGIIAESLVIGQRGTERFGLGYRLRIDPGWRVREVDIRMVNGPQLRLSSDGHGRWFDGDGADIPDLAGCIDVDIAATPFTNTLPIRRLDLAIGLAETIKVAYVLPTALTVYAVAQRYTRLAEHRYLYEGLTTGFSTELEVDGQGIVGDYPGVFRLVP